MDQKELRKIKKEYAKKFLLENPDLDKDKALLKLMGEFNMSRRYTKEILDVAIMENAEI